MRRWAAVLLLAACSGPATPPKNDGEPCTDATGCVGGLCLVADGGGVCATACESTTFCDAGRCIPRRDGRTNTLTPVCAPAGGDRFLSEACTADDQCRSGVCDDGHCSALCGTCPGAASCRPRTLDREGLSLAHGVCAWWPELSIVEIGSPTTPATGAASLSFTLPDGATAFTLVLEDAMDRVPVVTKLTAPDGTVLIGHARPPDGGASADTARCSSAPGTATALVTGAAPGTYTLEVATFAPMGFPVMPMQIAGHLDRVAAVLKRAELGGEVDVTLQVAPETGYALDGGTMTFMRQMLDRFDQIAREKMGASLGRVRITSLPPDAGATVDSLARARGLWTTYASGVPTARVVNVMVVDDLTFAAGVSGASPGAPGVYQRGVSGVVVEPLASGPVSTGVLLGHEVGHYLGLAHTSDEFFGPDLVADTPSCAAPSGANCPDARNLMFPYFPTAEPLSFTRGQRRLLEGSPWVSRFVHPLACGPHDVIGLRGGPFSRAESFAAGSTLGAPATLTGGCGGKGGERVHLLRLEIKASRITATARAMDSDFEPVVYLRRADCAAATDDACARVDGGVAIAVADQPAAGAWFVVVDSAADGGAYALDVTVAP